MSSLQAIILLSLFYMGLTTNFQFINIVIGVLISVAVTRLLRIGGAPLKWQRVPKMLWAFLRYVTLLTSEMIISGFQVARIVLNPALPIKPGIIEIDGQSRTEAGAALSAHAITLAPGELVIEMGPECELYTHCLDVSRSAEYISDAQKVRRDLLDQIFP